MIPVTNSLVPSFSFIKLLQLIKVYYMETNQLLKITLNSKILDERFDALSNIFYELNELSRLLASCYEYFLLASISSVFFMSLNLFYNLFLALNEIVYFSPMIIISTVFWIFFQIFIILSYIIGCEKIYQEVAVCSALIWKFNQLKLATTKKKSNVRIYLLNYFKTDSDFFTVLVSFTNINASEKTFVYGSKTIPNQLRAHFNILIGNRFIFDRYHSISL
jgi:hypothetical protein